MAASPIRLLLQLEIPQEHFLEFEAIIREMIAITEREPGATLYQFFLSDDHLRCRLLEEYVDVAAITAHFKGPVVQQLVPQMLNVSRLASLEFYGDPGREVAAMAAPLNPAMFSVWHGFDR